MSYPKIGSVLVKRLRIQPLEVEQTGWKINSGTQWGTYSGYVLTTMGRVDKPTWRVETRLVLNVKLPLEQLRNIICKEDGNAWKMEKQGKTAQKRIYHVRVRRLLLPLRLHLKIDKSGRWSKIDPAHT